MKLVKTHGNAELVKGPRMPKKKTKEIQEPISKKTNGHTKSLRERVNGWPKETQQD